MNRNKAEHLEEAIEHLARGESVQEGGGALLETVRQVQRLAAPVPPPPHKLAPGRQRLLAEAARLRAGRMGRRKEQRRVSGIMKLGTALVALILVSGFVLGAGQVMADSLPGQPLYGVKLAIEDLQVRLTGDVEARADLDLRLADRRMGEVEALLQQNRGVDEAIAARVQQQLELTLGSAVQEPDPAAAGTLLQLATAIQQRQRTMEKLAGETPEAPVRQLMREMERVRTEAHAGAGDVAGLRQRLRHGQPEPGVEPEPGTAGSGEPQQGEPGLGAGPGPGAQPVDAPDNGPGPGPQPEVVPGTNAGPGPQPVEAPDNGPGPGPQPEVEPGTGAGPGPQPVNPPDNGPGPGPQPAVDPDNDAGPGPQPVNPPDNGPGPGPQPAVDPDNGAGPGPQPEVNPDNNAGPGTQPATQPDPGDGQGTQPSSSPGGGSTASAPAPSTGGTRGP